MNTNEETNALLKQLVEANQRESYTRIQREAQPRGVPSWFIPIIGVVATASVGLLAWILIQSMSLGANIIQVRGEVATNRVETTGQYNNLREKIDGAVENIKELRAKNITENGGVQRLENRISGVEESVHKLDTRVDGISRDQTDMLELMKGGK